MKKFQWQKVSYNCFTRELLWAEAQAGTDRSHLGTGGAQSSQQVCGAPCDSLCPRLLWDCLTQPSTHLWHRVVVDINDFVEVSDDDLGDLSQPLEVICVLWGHIHVQGNGGQVTHSHLWAGTGNRWERANNTQLCPKLHRNNLPGKLPGWQSAPLGPLAGQEVCTR